ncbi:inosine triphosphate pyrophosphatase-like protein [Jimgerdemannia flammicorona]|uniref:Inosine triphosphate pyrophosphatase-like protein n=1 Tax=Jimgerdemannia flammicorona TaxID=994334 RepID=A0A433Q779_9FUNG|nr:inosine triphosphate pyrophosphatase-like protein [Jimgerdemannia flammicorona]
MLTYRNISLQVRVFPLVPPGPSLRHQVRAKKEHDNDPHKDLENGEHKAAGLVALQRDVGLRIRTGRGEAITARAPSSSLNHASGRSLPPLSAWQTHRPRIWISPAERNFAQYGKFTFPETLDKSKFAHPRDYVAETARQKTLEVYERLLTTHPADLVIGADTIVAIDSTILEKPSSPEDALRMLKSLRGRSHSVFTAVAMVYPNQRSMVGSETRLLIEETEVVFAEASDELLEACEWNGSNIL